MRLPGAAPWAKLATISRLQLHGQGTQRTVRSLKASPFDCATPVCSSARDFRYVRFQTSARLVVTRRFSRSARAPPQRPRAGEDGQNRAARRANRARTPGLDHRAAPEFARVHFDESHGFADAGFARKRPTDHAAGAGRNCGQSSRSRKRPSPRRDLTPAALERARARDA